MLRFFSLLGARGWSRAALTVLAGLLLSSEVAAQEFALTPPGSSTAGGDAATTARIDASVEHSRRRKLPRATVGVLVGMAGTGAGSLEVQGYRGRMSQRVGVHLGLPVRLGGERFGFVITPMLQTSKVFITRRDGYGNMLGDRETTLVGLGGYLGPSYTVRLSNNSWLSAGLGVKAMYLHNDAFRYAADFYARVPVAVTFAAARKSALSAEIGLGYGASVLANIPTPVFNPATGKVTLGDDNPSFGLGVAWDVAVGVSLP